MEGSVNCFKEVIKTFKGEIRAFVYVFELLFSIAADIFEVRKLLPLVHKASAVQKRKKTRRNKIFTLNRVAQKKLPCLT